MLNFHFSEKGLGLVSPSHFVYDFSRKMFLMLHPVLRSDTRHKSRLYHVDLFLRHYGAQLKITVKQKEGKKTDCKR